MRAIKLAIACTLLLAATAVNARQEKVLICHVGNEAGPTGETYLDDPYCVPSDLNDYFCPDAGKIDLIVVAEKSAASHLDSLSHYWDGISDYDPIAMGATGDGTEDSDGNGIDDGCEIPEECPCWAESNLQSITADNVYAAGTCNGISNLYPGTALISTPPGSFPIYAYVAEVEGPFIDYSYCEYLEVDLAGSVGEAIQTSQVEAQVCIAQIAQRCADIGHPIEQPN